MIRILERKSQRGCSSSSRSPMISITIDDTKNGAHDAPARARAARAAHNNFIAPSPAGPVPGMHMRN
jgi:hypothetical protein